jgi:hypothetical protein
MATAIADHPHTDLARGIGCYIVLVWCLRRFTLSGPHDLLAVLLLERAVLCRRLDRHRSSDHCDGQLGPQNSRSARRDCRSSGRSLRPVPSTYARMGQGSDEPCSRSHTLYRLARLALVVLFEGLAAFCAVLGACGTVLYRWLLSRVRAPNK